MLRSFILLSILLLGIHATAKELVWNVPKPPDGSQSTASYISDAGNWTPSGVPSDGDVLVFSDADLKSAATFDSPEVDFSGLIFNRWQRIEGQRLPGISAGSWTFNHSGGSSISPACNIERQDAVIRTSDYYTGVIFLGGLWFGEEGRTVTFSGEGLTDVHGFYGPHSATSRIVKNGEGILRIRAISSANSPEILVQGGRLAIDQKNPPVGQRVEIGTGGTLTGLGWIGAVHCSGKIAPGRLEGSFGGISTTLPGALFINGDFSTPAEGSAVVELDFLSNGWNDWVVSHGTSDFSRTDLKLVFADGYQMPMGGTATLVEVPVGGKAVVPFRNAGEGWKVLFGGAVFELSYLGGESGKSVVITRVPPPVPSLTLVHQPDKERVWLTMTAVPGMKVFLESSPDLITWTPDRLYSLTSAGMWSLSKPMAPGGMMFYRAYGVVP
jgi:hypothetical protein